MYQLSPLDLGDGIAGKGITVGNAGSANVQLLAGMAGGKRGRSRRMRGGSGMSPLASPGNANWAGDGIDGQGITVGDSSSIDVQMAAGMAGGKRGRGNKYMMGGTGNRGGPLGSAAVQLRAGLGN